MIKLVIDNIQLPVDGLYEHLTSGQLSANKQFNEGESMPDVSGMIGKKTCSSVHLFDENNVEIPLSKTYTVIEDFTVMRGSVNSSYTVSLS